MESEEVLCFNKLLFNNFSKAIEMLFFSAEDTTMFYFSPTYTSYWFMKGEKGEIKMHYKEIRCLLKEMDDSFRKNCEKPLLENPKLYDKIRKEYFSTIAEIADIIEEVEVIA
ncbi:MAG: hypothetical protein PHW96_03740 [Candidatus Nanoarchaeia archaeon]|nr:hypothetical protein [Candidatus Nanoarchaeia archaeon]